MMDTIAEFATRLLNEAAAVISFLLKFLVWTFCEKSVVAFLIVTVILGGGAAFLAGRALARTWKPLRNVMFYMVLLAIAVRFLHWGLFMNAALDSWREMQGTFFVGTQSDWAFPGRDKGGYTLFSEGRAVNADKNLVNSLGVEAGTEINSTPRYRLRIHYYLADLLILMAAAGLGYRLERTRQMTTQYRWIYERTGPFSWRKRY